MAVTVTVALPTLTAVTTPASLTFAIFLLEVAKVQNRGGHIADSGSRLSVCLTPILTPVSPGIRGCTGS